MPQYKIHIAVKFSKTDTTALLPSAQGIRNALLTVSSQQGLPVTHLCDSFDSGRRKGKAGTATLHRTELGTSHFPFSAENPRTSCCFSERLNRTSSPHVATVRAKASPCPAAQAGFHPLEGSARELPQFAFSAARLAHIRARSTQTPHK